MNNRLSNNFPTDMIKKLQVYMHVLQEGSIQAKKFVEKAWEISNHTEEILSCLRKLGI